MAKFSEVLEIKNGRNQRQVENPNGHYPIYGSGGIMGYADDYLCDADTVVIGRKGSINNPIFASEPFWNVDTAFGLVADRTKLLPKYLYYFCKNYDFERLNTTVTIPSLTKINLFQVEIPLPFLSEQLVITGILDKVNDLIAQRKLQLKQLDLMVKSRFIEMFGDEKGFVQTQLKDIGVIIGGLTKNDGKRKKHELTVPYLRVANVFFNHLDLTEVMELKVQMRELEKGLLKRGDLLFVEGNGSIEQVGRVAIWDGSIEPCVHQNHLIKARFDLNSVVPVYALHFFMSQQGRKQILERAVSTSGLHTLSVSKIENMHIPLPPLALQNAFADFVQQVDKSKFGVQQGLQKLEIQYNALMQQYFG